MCKKPVIDEENKLSCNRPPAVLNKELELPSLNFQVLIVQKLLRVLVDNESFYTLRPLSHWRNVTPPTPTKFKITTLRILRRFAFRPSHITLVRSKFHSKTFPRSVALWNWLQQDAFQMTTIFIVCLRLTFFFPTCPHTFRLSLLPLL